jgi:transposase
LKSQLIICEQSEEVIATYFGKGKMHDLKLFEKSRVRLSKEVEIKADSGYQGLQKKHAKVLIPQKNSKLHRLTKEDKRLNRALSKKRIKVENVIRKLKIFRILAERYRHRRKRLGLRFNLLSGIYNFELKAKTF